jgi:hypothetical protein
MRLLLTCCLLVLLISCQPNNALQYNQQIVTLENSLIPDIQRTESSVGDYAVNGHYDSISIVSHSMELKVDSVLKKVERLNVPASKEGQDFNKESIRYFRFMKNIYAVYDKFGKSDERTRPEVLNEVVDIVNRKESVLAKMQAAQRRFAKASGFRIQDRPKASAAQTTP